VDRPRAICHAGTHPNSKPAAIDTTVVNKSARASSAREIRHRLRGEHQLEKSLSDRESGRAAEDREHHALGEQLPRDTAASRAESMANRNLAAADARARQQQIAEVRTRDQEHERDGAHEHEQLPPHAADDALLQGHDVDAGSFIELWPLTGQPVTDHAHLRVCLRECRATGEASDHFDEVLIAIRSKLRREVRGHDVVELIAKAERLRHHADNRIRRTVQIDDGADGSSIAGEQSLPQLIADDHHRWSVGLLVLQRERAAGKRGHAEHGHESPDAA
jgi:hypothetical protein